MKVFGFQKSSFGLSVRDRFLREADEALKQDNRAECLMAIERLYKLFDYRVENFWGEHARPRDRFELN